MVDGLSTFANLDDQLCCLFNNSPFLCLPSVGNRIKGHKGARIHKTSGQESSRGGGETTNNFYQQCLHMFAIHHHCGNFPDGCSRYNLIKFSFENLPTWQLLVMISSTPLSLSKSAKEGFNGGGDVELNESGSLWPPLGMGPSQHCPPDHQPALQLGRHGAHEPNRWPINWVQKRQQGIRAKALEIKIESFALYIM